MKTLKTLFTLLLMTVSMAVSAQTIVAVEKTDGTTDNYNLADVDSVVYEPAEEVKYYYYAGWTCPKNLTELANLAVSPNGGVADMTKTYTKSDPLVYYGGECVNSTRAKYYMVIPNGISIYDSEGDASQMDQFDEITDIVIEGHKIYQYQVAVKAIGGMMLR